MQREFKMSTSDKAIEDLFPDSDAEWEKMMSAMNDEELVVYLRSVCELLSSNGEKLPPTITPELIEQIRQGGDKFEVAIHRAKIAEQNAAIAKAAVDRAADALLAGLPDKKRGN